MKNQMNNKEISVDSCLYRHTTLEADNNATEQKKNREFWLVFSSEEPVERNFGMEILDHNNDSVVMKWLSSGRAPLLLDHDPSKQIGVVQSACITPDGKAKAKVKFSKSQLAEGIYQDVLDGIRSNVSVGYRYMQDGVTLESEGRDGGPDTYRIKHWQPLEVSMVSIPADHTTGVMRHQTINYSVKNYPINYSTNNRSNIRHQKRIY